MGGNKAITENNLLVFLAMIEHKTLQITSTYKQLTNSHMLAQNQKVGHHPNIMLTFDDFEDNEEYNKILTA